MDLIRSGVELALSPFSVLALFAGAGIAKPSRLRTACFAAAFVFLYAASAPFLSSRFLASLETVYPPGPPAEDAARSRSAIVVLSAESRRMAPEYGRAFTVGPTSLERIRRGARLARETGSPVLVTGGGEPAVADGMAEALAHDFGVEPRWIERCSKTTMENARFSAAILRRSGFEEAVVVTHAYHMRRALLAFRQAGFPARAAPTAFTSRAPLVLAAFLPRAGALAQTYLAAHERIGLLAYKWGWAGGRREPPSACALPDASPRFRREASPVGEARRSSDTRLGPAP